MNLKAIGKKGQVDIGQLMLIVIVPIILVIGLITFSYFESSIDHSAITSSASSTINTTATNTYSGFDLGSVLPIVIAATIVLAIVMGALRFRQ